MRENIFRQSLKVDKNKKDKIAEIISKSIGEETRRLSEDITNNLLKPLVKDIEEKE